ncbi:MAG: hypothetical protein IME93_07975 [Proteobacteria bacterium]|nr:hypothetical protein [Pseudomonadota bacterium]
MSLRYTATAKQNPGRKSWLVEFRHPLKTDNNNKPGKKTRKGLGTNDEQEAQRLTTQLNRLLSDESLWSIGLQADAAKQFDDKVVEIFYDEIAPRTQSAVQLRDKLLPLPDHSQGYARVALLGVPGAGKTTLLRQLIGTHPERERFPSTSVNRTTTFPTEITVADSEYYRAVVTFMSEHETRFEIEESLSAALVKAIDSSEQKVAETLLEKSDMRFRLKYILGDLPTEAEEIDPYDYDEEEIESAIEDPSEITPTDEEKVRSQQLLTEYVARIMVLIQEKKAEVEHQQGLLVEMSTEDCNAAMDLIEEEAVASDAFLELTSDMLDEIRTKFELMPDGKFEKTTTGWPRAWHLETAELQRKQFLKSVRFFSGIAHQSWGKLLTPLVNGMRVSGPFKPSWANTPAKLVLIDTEGLGHKAGATADLSEQTLALLHNSDVILLVDSAKNSLTNFAAGKALEGIVNTGHTQKLAVVFTHMDMVNGPNLKGRAKLNHIFGGLRNVAENQLAKNVSTEAARHLLHHLESNTFYVGKIDKADPKPAIPELTKLLDHLAAAQPPVFEPVSFPKYSSDNLVLAIQEASTDFRQQWNGRLGLAQHAEITPSPWQGIKAMSRRYAEGWDDGFYLRPASNLITSLSAAISRFLENPIEWSGQPTAEQKRETIDRIKAAVTQKIPEISSHRLRELAQPAWHAAYALRGTGSTFERRQRISGIYAKYVPIPDAKGDKLVFEFLSEIKGIVMQAIDGIEQEVNDAN